MERTKAEGARGKALSKNGELRGAIASQNKSILDLASKSAYAQTATAAALAAFGPIKASIMALATSIAAQKPSLRVAKLMPIGGGRDFILPPLYDAAIVWVGNGQLRVRGFEINPMTMAHFAMAWGGGGGDSGRSAAWMGTGAI
ncbi:MULTISPECIES: hypothetical protein [unclassified Janthinobacterium]|uniref:hypothetical protein n=1 Tax=unclassified Janthinobacterium TaxID=2610881 RepID=UPI00160D45E1|nr:MULTISPECIES: hypothetical protein [unclassified Janthinobacterium]MBB5369451.1 hypothetical protein [Janthinobacterium sp. K2C7]MBB5382593.1 hypothetical protein [Janthinobacterium sp. K2Li3]MBB5388170.1 hypothetical protein [Janthinobacterium sp. K2E3]